MKMSRFKNKRIKQLQEVLKTLDKYPEYTKNLEYHKNRVNIVEWILASELNKASSVKDRFNNIIESFPLSKERYIPGFGEYFRDEMELTCAMLYNYIYKRELSNL